MGEFTRRKFLQGSMAAGLAAPLGALSAIGASPRPERGASNAVTAGPEKYNILWIMTDEQRPDSLGCYGSPWARTPNLDRLAARGVTFHECHVQSPVCLASRTSMLMGRYPQELIPDDVNGHAFEDGILDPSRKSFVNLFADAGYRTANIGKWHTPKHPTWQENIEFILCQKNGQWTAADCYSLMKPYNEEKHRVIKRKGLSPIILSGLYPHHDWGETPSGHLTDMAINWLRDAAKCDRPFLLRVSHLWPHSPVLVPQPWDKLYDPDAIPFRPFNRKAYENRSAFDRHHSDIQQCADLSEMTWRRIRADYFGLCAYVDYEVGRLLRTLDELALADRTIVVFNSDHGKSQGEIGLSEKGNFDREVWRVPFILSGPGLPGNEHRHDLNENMDLGATLGALAGIDFPPDMRGRNLFQSSEPEAVFGIIDLYGQRRVAIRTKQFRFDCTVPKGAMKIAGQGLDANLIDVEHDPWEERNLILDPHYASTANQMRHRIEAWLALTGMT